MASDRQHYEYEEQRGSAQARGAAAVRAGRHQWHHSGVAHRRDRDHDQRHQDLLLRRRLAPAGPKERHLPG